MPVLKLGQSHEDLIMFRMERFQDESTPPLNKGYLGEEKKRPSKKKGLKHNFSKMLAESSVTGVSAVVNSEGWCRKLVKLIILSIGVAGFLIQSLEFYRLYQEYSTVDIVERLDIMKRPAITLCDDNILRRQFLCTNKPDVCEILNVTKEKFCTMFMPYCLDTEDVFFEVPKPNLLDAYPEDFYDYNFTKLNGFLLENSLLQCEWLSNYRSKNGSVISTPCGEPEYVRGVNNEKFPAACYTLKSSPHMLDEELKKNSKLRLTFRWHTSDLIVEPQEFAVEDAIVGFFWMSFHYYGDKSNPFADGFKLTERNRYKIEVSETDYIRLPPPYSTMCHDYVKEWKENGFQGPLVKEHCQALCEINAGLESFGCVPKDIDYPHGEKLCTDFPIFVPVVKKKIQECIEQCRDPCSYSEYLAVPEVAGKIDTSTAEYIYGTRMVTVLEVHFNSLKSKVITSRPKYESVELFSYIGGYLGMWLGWSLIALFDFIEILFFAMMRPLIRRRRRKKKTIVRPFINQNLHQLEKI